MTPRFLAGVEVVGDVNGRLRDGLEILESCLDSPISMNSV